MDGWSGSVNTSRRTFPLHDTDLPSSRLLLRPVRFEYRYAPSLGLDLQQVFILGRTGILIS